MHLLYSTFSFRYYLFFPISSRMQIVRSTLRHIGKRKENINELIEVFYFGDLFFSDIISTFAIEKNNF